MELDWGNAIMNTNPNSELNQSIVNVPSLAQVPEILLEHAYQFQEMMMMYTCAIREIKTKLEVLNDELSVRNSRNPIEMIKSRVKKPTSIVEKLQRRGLPVTLESVQENLDDVAGIRVICSFLDDIYAVADMLTRQDDVHIIAIKDYIRNPKENGYRSYHMIVEIPVFFSDRKKWMRVEVQIRTIAMDFWASLDHQLKYKKEIGDVSEEISRELKESADLIAQTDERMLNIRKKIEAQGITVSK
jgi:putative GTP pyrophosphokinase